MIDTQLLIGGYWRPATDLPALPVPDPAQPTTIVGRAASASPADVDAAVEAAAAAQPSWAALPAFVRADYLRAAADKLDDGLADRIGLLVSETGKVRREATMEMARFAGRLRDTAELAAALDDVEYSAPPRRSVLHYAPIGVVGLIVPWNWPLSILGAKLPQALLAGNTVVVKPSPGAPLATMQTLALVADVLPPGVINAVTGPASTGTALVQHVGVQKVDFTGGTETGKAIAAAAAPNLTRLTLELGGNDAALVLSDAEITSETLGRLMMATFATTGQVCMAIKRLYVHTSRFDEVVDGMVDLLSHTAVGPGAHPQATMGPLHNSGQRDLVRGLLTEATAAGANVMERGEIVSADAFSQGWFMRPAIVTGAEQKSSLVQREQFGPALPVLPFDDEVEAIALANDSEYGLCSSVWTADVEHGLDVARRLQAGTTYLNHHGPAAQDDRVPFGGVKNSGIGRQLGTHGIHEFTERHSITIY